jgi:hypothetical protein
MAKSSKYKPPKESGQDYGHAVVRAGLGVIPFGGTAAIEIFNKVVTPPIEKRRDEWRQLVGERLQQLEEDGEIDLAELVANEIFATTILQATQVAIRNHHEEKIEALRNAVINAALPNPPDESIQLMFLNLVDTFTVWHLRLLRLFQNPKGWFEENNKQAPSFSMTSSIAALLTAAYPELSNQRRFYDLVVSELDAKGLSTASGTHVMMSATGAFEKRTTELGDKFLQFITDPIKQ